MREREAETQEEGEAVSMPGAWLGTRSQDSRIVPWAKGRHQTTVPPRDPLISFLRKLSDLIKCAILRCRRVCGLGKGCSSSPPKPADRVWTGFRKLWGMCTNELLLNLKYKHWFFFPDICVEERLRRKGKLHLSIELFIYVHETL